MAELSIVDIREIVRIIKEKYGFDLSNFALTSLKYSLEKAIARNGMLNAEGLLRKLGGDSDFLDLFLSHISVPSTEMFRDPSLWRWLRESQFNNTESKPDNYKIWLPSCVSGGELYSLCIILKEQGILDQVRIIATSFSNAAIDYMKSGEYPLKKLEVSIENYRRLHGKEDFSKYYTLDNGIVKRDSSLLDKVEFVVDDINFNKAPKNVKIILYRNSLIYYNPGLQSKILEHIHSILSVQGILILGAQEHIRDIITPDFSFDLTNKDESVYKKKI